MNNCARSLSSVAMMTMIVILLFALSPADCFQGSTLSPRGTPSTCTVPNGCSSSSKWLSAKPLSQPMLSSMVLKSSPSDGDNSSDGAFDAGGILGTIASIVVLYSEFTLKTTGCGLPAGPFGLVGAVEGVSYLGVVGICATAVVGLVSNKETNNSPEPTATGRLATTLGLLAVVVGIAVLAFQVLDYGYIPNAVPMEGGMCK